MFVAFWYSVDADHSVDHHVLEPVDGFFEPITHPPTLILGDRESKLNVLHDVDVFEVDLIPEGQRVLEPLLRVSDSIVSG